MKGIYLADLSLRMVDISTYYAIAVVPKNKDFLQGANNIPLSKFMELGTRAGAAAML